MPTNNNKARTALGWSLLGTAILVVAVVLPAKYGIDPTGFGKLTGLVKKVTTAAPARKVWSISHGEKYQLQTYEVQLKGDEELEYKAHIESGEPLLYSWRVKQGTPVYFEFHGEPTEGKWPEDYYESYEKGESSGGQGSMVAPFTGAHGWYWLNLSAQPVTIIVELAGYYREFGRQGDPPP